MARVRSIYNNFALYAGPSPSTGSHAAGINQLHRLQTINWGFTIPKENVNQVGQLAAIDRVSTESPTVSLDFSYNLTDMHNENSLGFSVNSGVSALAGILQKIGDDRNYFVLVVAEGEDAVGKGGADGAVVGVGNGFLSNYTAEGAVGGFPTASLSVEGLNIKGYADGVAEDIPAVDPENGVLVTGQTYTLPTAVSGGSTQATAIQPGDITVSFSSNEAALLEDITNVPLQSYSISFDLSRENIQKLGSRYSFSREIQFPVDVNVGIEAIAGDLTTGDLSLLLCDDAGYDITVALRQPVCGTGVGAVAAQYEVKNAKLDSQNWSLDIGPSQTVSINFIAQISASGDTNNGVFMSGITGYA